MYFLSYLHFSSLLFMFLLKIPTAILHKKPEYTERLTDFSESTDRVDFKALFFMETDSLWFVSLMAFSLGEPCGVAMGVAAVCVIIGGFKGPSDE